MIERVIVRAEEVRVGDRFHASGDVPGRIAVPAVRVSSVEGDGGTVEVFADHDPLGMPAATYEVGETVAVWREVSR